MCQYHGRLNSSSGSRVVSTVDFCVDGRVTVSGSVDAIVGIGQNGSQGLHGAFAGFVEHLRFELRKFVFQVREILGQSLDDGGVVDTKSEIIGSVQVLSTLQRRHEIAPETGLLREAGVLRVEIEMSFAESRRAHDDR